MRIIEEAFEFLSSMEDNLLQEDILVENIANVRSKYPMIDDDKFNELIKLDPTFNSERDSVGTYGKWILDKYKSKSLTDNDLGHLRDALTRFDESKKYLKNKDIYQFRTLTEIDDYLNDENNYNDKSARQIKRENQREKKNVDINSDADKVFEDSEWEVWISKTYAASCRLGDGTKWCTANTNSDYYYNYYKNKYGGKYYIIINKQDPTEKYQFHFESNQFMDRRDVPIDVLQFLKKDSQLYDFFYNERITKSNSDMISMSEAQLFFDEDGLRENVDRIDWGDDIDEFMDIFEDKALTDPTLLNILLQNDDVPAIIYHYGDKVINSKPIMKRLSAFVDGANYHPIIDASTLADSEDTDFDESQLNTIMRGEAFEWFFDTYYDMDWRSVSSYYIDDIDDRILEKHGLPNHNELADSIKNMDDDEFEETYGFILDDIKDAIIRAVEEGKEVGAESEMMESFKSAVVDSLPVGVTLSENPPLCSGDTFFVVNVEPGIFDIDSDNFNKELFNEVIECVYDGDDTNLDVCAIERYIKNNFEFREPYYGWDGDDKDAMNDRLDDLLYWKVKLV